MKYFIFSLIGFLNGLLGSGGGTMTILALKKYSDMDLKKIHAVVPVVILPLSLISAVIYLANLNINFRIVIMVTVFSVIGVFIGIKLLDKIKKKLLKNAFAILMIISAIAIFFR